MFGAAKQARQLRGLFDEFQTAARSFLDTGGTVSDACVTQATNEMARIDADVVDVQDNWKPTNFYTVEQIQQIGGLGLKVKQEAFNALQTTSAMSQLEAHREFLIDASNSLSNNKAIDVQPLIKAVIEAEKLQKTTNRPVIIESPGLKRWLVAMLKAAREARFVCAAVNCARPGFLLGVLAALDKASQALVAFAKAIGNVVKTAVDIVLKIPDFLGTVLKIVSFLPAVIVVVGGYYVATKTVLPPKYDPLRLRERETFRPWRKQG